MADSRIFISYRRDDSAGFARAIGDALGQRFGRERIWLDVDDIGVGKPFDAEIELAVGTASVLLVLIGRRWAGPIEGSTLRRIDDPQDFVRHEVETGLARGMALIPLLLDGAPMPTERDLPEALHGLARRQALPIDNARFDTDMARLEGVLREALARRADAGGTPSRRRFAWAGGAAVLLAAGGFAWRRSQARPPVNGRWTAGVNYDWPNANYVERFSFDGEGTDLYGKASFLRTDRAILDGRIDADGNLLFTVRTQEEMGGGSREATHRYRGRLKGDEIRFTMQTEGGFSSHVPVDFVAQRVR